MDKFEDLPYVCNPRAMPFIVPNDIIADAFKTATIEDESVALRNVMVVKLDCVVDVGVYNRSVTIIDESSNKHSLLRHNSMYVICPGLICHMDAAILYKNGSELDFNNTRLIINHNSKSSAYIPREIKMFDSQIAFKIVNNTNINLKYIRVKFVCEEIILCPKCSVCSRNRFLRYYFIGHRNEYICAHCAEKENVAFIVVCGVRYKIMHVCDPKVHYYQRSLNMDINSYVMWRPNKEIHLHTRMFNI